MALVKPKHLVPLGPVALDGVVRNLSILRLEGEKADDDPLGVRLLVRKGLLTARSGKEQADLLDTFKEKIKAMTTTHPPTPVSLPSLEEAYALMLQLYLHPRTALLKKATHRILLQLVALAAAQSFPTLETTQAQTFIDQWIQENGLLRSESIEKHARVEISTILQLIDEMAFFGPTRAALCRGRGVNDHDYSIQPFMRYTIKALVEAARPFVQQKSQDCNVNGGSQQNQQKEQQQRQQQQQHEGSVGLAQEALKAWTTLFAAWNSATEDGAERQSMLHWLCGGSDINGHSSSSSESLFSLLLNSTVCFLGAALVPSEMKGQAALGLILATLHACPAVQEARDTQARALQSCFLPTSTSSSITTGHFPSFPALNSVAPLLTPLAQNYPEARLSLAKALLIATPVSILTTPLPRHDTNDDGHSSGSSGGSSGITTLLGGPVLDLLLAECQSPLPSARLLAFMSLETWLLRAAEYVHAATATAAAPLGGVVDALSLKSALPTTANFLFWNWETTNRRVATVVPSAFERLVQLLQALEKLGEGGKEGERIEGCQPLPSGLLSIAQLATMLAKQPASRRSRYAGLKILVPVVGAAQLLTQSPTLIPSLLDAITGSSSTAASASRLFLQILRNLSAGTEQGKISSSGNSSSHDKVRTLWLRPVAAALVDGRDGARRVRVADYLLEELLSLDAGGNILALLHELRRLAKEEEDDEHDQHQQQQQQQQQQRDRIMLWALLVVAEVARRLGGGQLTSTKVGGKKAGKAATIVDVEVGAAYPMLSVAEARQGCLSGFSEVRMAALRMLVASPKTTTIPTLAEQALLEEALPIALKAPLSSQRHGLERALRPLFLRYQEALRVALGKLHAQIQRGGKLLPKGSSLLLSPHPSLPTQEEAAIQRIEICIARIGRILCEGFYPGTNVSRNAPTLDVLALYLAIIQPPKCADEITSAVYARALHPIHASSTTVHTLLNLFLAPWERTRKAAFDLLVSFPAPLCGLGDTPEDLAPAVAWALQLTLSARRGESEAGALMLRLVFEVYVVGLGWEGIPLLGSNSSSSNSNSSSSRCTNSNCRRKGESRTLFLQELVELIEVRLAAFQRGLAAWGHKKIVQGGRKKGGDGDGGGGGGGGGGVTMVYGAIQAAKYVLEEATLSCSTVGENKGWNEAVVSLMTVLDQALEVSLGIIGTAGEGLPDSLFSELGDENREGGGKEGGVEEYREEAALHTAGPGLVVDCRGHLIRRGKSDGGNKGREDGMNCTQDNGKDNEEGGDEDDDARQRLIVGGWMMVKEVGACLAEIVSQAVAPYSTAIGSNTKFKNRRQQKQQPDATVRGHVKSDMPDLLACLGGSTKIDSTGRSLLEALGRMKHMGAIQVTQAALLAVSKALLLCSSYPSLALLPRTWMEGLLDRLRNPRQHFVLRRSAGLASGFLSIVGAEPANRPPVLLPTLMTQLLSLASDSNNNSNSSSNSSSSDNGDCWRTRIHALNVLRLLLLDSGPSRDVAQRFMAPAMEVVLEGFRDSRWAVRNSALMVFGALINSVVGSGKNCLGAADSGEGERGGGGGLAGAAATQAGPSSAHDFLRRHPDFLFIVAGELKRGMEGEVMKQGRRNSALVLALKNLASVGVAAVASFENEKSTKAVTTNPSLFPLILLLSRLRPPSEQLAEDETSSALDLSLKECLPSVAQCACLPDGLMRLTAARAFASLVGPSRAPLVVAALVSALPSSPLSSSCDGRASASLDCNVLHGILLMTNALLRGTISVTRRLYHENTEDREVKMLLSYLAPLFSAGKGVHVWEEKTWLAGPTMTCPPVREEALQMFLHFHHLFALFEQQQQHQYQQQQFLLHEILSNSLTDLLDIIRDGDNRISSLPGFAGLLAWATRWGLLLSLQNRDKAGDRKGSLCLLEKFLTTWIRHGVVEVRQESLRVLLFLLNKRGVDLGEGKTEEDEADEYHLMHETVWRAGRQQYMPGDALWEEAEMALIAQVEGCERNPNLIKGQMAALCLLLERKKHHPGLEREEETAGGKPGYLWRLVSDASSQASSASASSSSSVSVISGGGGDIAARALELMGHFVRQEMDREEGVVIPSPSTLSSHSLPKVVEGWVGLLEAAAVPEQAPAMRMAALQSVRASNLMTQLQHTSTTVPWQGPLLVRTLFIVSLLAQDDEDDVREAARAALADAVCACDEKQSTDPTLASATASRSSPATPCLDLIAGRALARLAAHNPAAGNAWTRAVVRLVALRIQGLATTLEDTIIPPCLGLPQQIFRPEPDNVYEEQAVVCYWAVRSLLVALAAEEEEEKEELRDNRSIYWQEGEMEELRSSSSPLKKVEIEDLFPLHQYASLLAKAFESSAWIGGLTNHPDVFSKLFAAFLGWVLRTVLQGEGKGDYTEKITTVLEVRGTDHPLMAWALRSVLVILMRMKSETGEETSGSVGSRARTVLKTVNWAVVDDYAPFVRPSL
ncbi:Hypothetical protein NocV09_02600720 [Nannochloropsis oceanica]